ncbi:MAG: PQQ-binding-like beta-propeller repeat protein [Anaerolineae bacterium]|nr:PQQ-binding-like beta-propeller repeat protein [Anaerolineae bacterium]
MRRFFLSLLLISLITFPAVAQENRDPIELEHEGAIRFSWLGEGDRIQTSGDNTLYVWNSASGDLIYKVEFEASIGQVSYNPDESVALVIVDQDIAFINLEDGSEISRINYGDTVYLAHFDEDGTKVMATGADGKIHTWDIDSGEELLEITPNSGDRVMSRIFWTNDYQSIWAAFNAFSSCESNCDGILIVYDANSGDEQLRLEHDDRIDNIRWTTDGSRVATWATDGNISIWDSATGDLLATFEHDLMLEGVVWSHDGTRLLTWENAERDCEVRCRFIAHIWDVETGEALADWQHGFAIESGEWSDDDSFIITATLPGIIVSCYPNKCLEIRITDSSDGSVVQQRSYEQWGRIELNQAETNVLVGVGNPPSIHIMNVETGRSRRILEHDGDWFWWTLWSSRERFIAAVSFDGTVYVLDANSYDIEMTSKVDVNRVSLVSWSPDDTKLVFISQPEYDCERNCKSVIYVWDFPVE